MSASMMPTLPPHLASAIAMLTATVVFPTPPLPAPTAMTFLTPGTDWRGPPAPPTPASPASRRAPALAHRAAPAHPRPRGPRLLANLLLHRPRRRSQLDRERHLPA